MITDHLGSIRLVVNVNTGAIAQRIDYDEFGSVITNTNPGFQPFAFAGGLYDAQTKLVRFGARDYDASVGRWQSKEPLGFAGGNNFYSYVINDPINKIDVNGRNPLILAGALVGGVYGFGSTLLSDAISGEWSSWKTYVANTVGV